MRRRTLVRVITLLAAAGCGAGTAASRSPARVNAGDAGDGSAAAAGASSPDGSILALAGGLLDVAFCTDDVVRVAFAEDAAFFRRPSLATSVKRCPGATPRVSRGAGEMTWSTPRLTVRADLATGAVNFLDPGGRTILAEKPGGRTIAAASLFGQATTSVRQEWIPGADESLYGLGQHQQGHLDIRGLDLALHQYNTEVVVPFLVSSKGYGVLWDNPSFTRFGDLAEATPLPVPHGLYADGGRPGDVAPGDGHVSWTGTVTPAVSGEYTFRTFSAGTIKLTVDHRVVIDHFRQDWLPDEDIARVPLVAGKPVAVSLTWAAEGKRRVVRLLWKAPPAEPTTSLWSQAGGGVDYWFVYGPALDDVVAGYRRLTGDAPMMPRWAYGFWQSKERYRTAAEVTDVLEGYRKRGAPIDNIVQDWRYWRDGQWGSHEFDPDRYPDPDGWIRAIHEKEHAQLMISVWPRFYPETATYRALHAAGFLYAPNVTEGTRDFLDHPFATYDAFDPGARRLFWSQIDRALFSRGVDAFWLDSPEPEVAQGPFDSLEDDLAAAEQRMNPTALGPGALVMNAYTLENSRAVYEGQRASAPDRRVFILTRSAYAGQQRYAAATWSGDITSTWTAMKRQIPAGLGFSISGIPYWTFDSGGFHPPARFSAKDPAPADVAEWGELNTRWLEYATFLPIMRVHGEWPPREIWQFGGDGSPAYRAMLKFDRLRYRLLPYVYSLAGGVTREGGTLLRPLVMDFPGDRAARRVDDEYLFGPALLVSPVTAYRARSRPVYLPRAAGWYDFWTGQFSETTSGGRTIDAPAPFDAIPVHVRAGSIVPTGPELHYAAEKPPDPIVLYVFAGADGSFSLYEDDGTTYDYERGASSIIPLRWNDAARTLTIAAREGRYDGMLAERTFQVVLVGGENAGHAGFSFEPRPDRTVTYRGATVDVVLK